METVFKAIALYVALLILFRITGRAVAATDHHLRSRAAAGDR
jgi:hypothetical protein